MIAAAALILCAPMLVAIAVAVNIKLGSPILFKQMRPGKNGDLFPLYKFRTMVETRNENGQLLEDEKRLTPFGRWLRSTSLDELPELWNVLCGDMSIIGPRPLLMEYLDRYTPEQARRHEVKPGITGWAQVCGRNKTSWEERFAFDVWYVCNQSLWLDLKILVLTIIVVLTRRGISADGHETMPRFNVPPVTSIHHDRAA